MKSLFITILILVLLIGGILLLRDNYIKRKYRKLVAQRYQVVEPLLKKLELREAVTELEILTLSKDPALRLGVFHSLRIYNKSHLFPATYLTREKGAESFLVNWLEFPTELGSAPDKIELLTKVSLLDDELLDYYVFQYTAKIPRLANQQDWMMGVTGPYRKDSLPFDVPLRIFSRFNTVGSISPEEEAQWVHNNINPT